MSSINDLVIQLQLVKERAPQGFVPIQTTMCLAIRFGRPTAAVIADPELVNAPTFLDHSSFIKLLRRLLPLDSLGSRSQYNGSATRDDLEQLLKTFGRDPIEVDQFMTTNVPETEVPLPKFLRIIAKPIAGQRYPIGVYNVSRPLEGSAKTASQNYSRIHRRDRAKTAVGMPIPRDGLAMTLARRSRYQKYRASIQRHRARRNSDATDSSSESGFGERDLGALAFKLRGLQL